MINFASKVSARNAGWLLFFAGVSLAWLTLFLMALNSTELAYTRIYGAEFWAQICAVDVGSAGFAGLFLMWILMSGAMMAPTFVPSLLVFEDIAVATNTDRSKLSCLLAGYLAIWVGFSALAAALQIGFSQLGWMAGSQSVSTPLNAVLLIGAGLYQFTAFKDACLSKCRQPLMFFMQHWESGPLRMGLRLGAVCVGCCWLLMLLGFVGGTMNLLWMGAATLLMVVEKLPEIGRYLTKPLGVILIISGVITALI